MNKKGYWGELERINWWIIIIPLFIIFVLLIIMINNPLHVINYLTKEDQYHLGYLECERNFNYTSEEIKLINIYRGLRNELTNST